jgi:serine protease inhibitor
MFLRLSALACALFLAACAATPAEREEPASNQARQAVPAPEPAAEDSADLPITLVEGQAEFGLALYRVLGEKPGNLFLSPVSLSTALGMVYAGAEGQTAAEMASALRFPGRATHDQAAALLRALPADGEGRKLTVASALWVQEAFPLRPAFLSVMRDRYGSPPRGVDFVDAPDSAIAEVNRWAEEQTNGRIRGLIQRANVNHLTRLILTNAVWFKADWLRPFQARQTGPRPFHLAAGGTVQVPMMRQRGNFRLLEAPAFEAVEMPYKGEEFSMLIFLPRTRAGLKAFEAELDAGRLSGWIDALRTSQPRDLELVVPKIELETRGSLVAPLQALGMRRAFTSSAQLGGIAEADLRVSEVIHQTWLRVDEKGTEAAAATGAIAEIVSVPRPFHADHPFFFAIYDKRTKTLLFIGRIERPSPPSTSS